MNSQKADNDLNLALDARKYVDADTISCRKNAILI